MKVKTLLERISYRLLAGSLEGEVTGICQDSRKVKAGDCFICLTGTTFDSHKVLPDILAAHPALVVVEKVPTEAELTAAENSAGAGTTVVLVEDSRKAVGHLSSAFYGYPSEHMTMLGVTGSKGKTTVTDSTAAVLREAGLKVGTVGSSGCTFPYDADFEDQLPEEEKKKIRPSEETEGLSWYELYNSTPDGMELQKLLSYMVQTGCTHAVVEVSSQAMKMSRVEGITFDYAVFTNLEKGDHIGGAEHKDFDEYLHCKAALMNQSRLALLNRDNAFYEDYRAAVTLSAEQVKTFGQNEEADIRLSGFESLYHEETHDPEISFDVTAPVDGRVHCHLPGEISMYNAAAAAIMGTYCGVDLETINRALMNLNIRGRFDIIYDGAFRVCIDFAHNGISLKKHLEACRAYEPKRLVCVFGASGGRTKDRRTGMGEAASSLADFTIICEEHNRMETFEAILRDILEGVEAGEATLGRQADYMVIPNREKAIRFAIENARDGDFITIVGLGGETYQFMKGKVLYHSDIDYSKGVLRDMGLIS